MTLTQAQQERFYDWQAVQADLTVSDIEASTKALIKQWESEWWNYILDGGNPPGSDRPPNKPPHP